MSKAPRVVVGAKVVLEPRSIALLRFAGRAGTVFRLLPPGTIGFYGEPVDCIVQLAGRKRFSIECRTDDLRVESRA